MTGWPLTAAPFDRKRFERLADGLAAALAFSLPWSTSATGILAGLWLLALIPTLDFQSMRRVILSPAGGLPVLLVTLGVLGMLWADVVWAERVDGVGSFIKLLTIPLFLHQFSRSDNGGRYVLGAFLISCVVLLIASWLLLAWPRMPWPGRIKGPGLPVKDYIGQSALFTVCIFVIARFAHDVWRNGQRRLALALVILALIFLANILYVATSRTALVVVPILLTVLGYRLFRWKGAVVLVAGCLVAMAAAWPSAAFLQERVVSFFDEVRSYEPGAAPTPAGERLEFWRKSARFVSEAPVIGHGTGAIRELFRRSAVGQTGVAAMAATNPHNQILGVGIQLGVVGIVVLLAMWIAHLALFRSSSVAAWVGLVVVIQNVVGSLFNSHLFDFMHGWVYVIGVGIAGGIVLKEARERAGAPPIHSP